MCAEKLTIDDKGDLSGQIEALDEEIRSYDAACYGLRSGIKEAVETLERILEGDRIKRTDIEKVVKLLENSEGY